MYRTIRRRSLVGLYGPYLILLGRNAIVDLRCGQVSKMEVIELEE
jgi:hypothetical protein